MTPTKYLRWNARRGASTEAMIMMRTGIAIVLSMLLPLLGLPAIGQAQSTVQVQGVLQSVDCVNGTITIDTDSGSSTVEVAPYGTVLVDSTSTPLCSLDTYTGAQVNAWLVANGDTFEVARLDVVGQAAPPPPPPAPAPAVSPLPVDGVVLGTVVVAGLAYLLVQGSDGGYYRYPYYGAYYQYYYRPYYRPFVGVVPAVVPIITVPAAIFGVVLGTVIVGSLAYILTRDATGHYYRYPYYGPYRQYYGTRPEFRPYGGPTGSWNGAPVRQGDPRWDRNTQQTQYQRPNTQPTPAYHGPTQTQPSQYRGPTTPPTSTYHGPTQTQPYQYRGPTTPPAPTYHGPTQTQPSQYRGPTTPPAPTYHGPTQTQPYQYRGPTTPPTPTYHGPTQTQPSQYRGPTTPPTPTYRDRTNGSSSQSRGGEPRQCGRGSQDQSCQSGR